MRAVSHQNDFDGQILRTKLTYQSGELRRSNSTKDIGLCGCCAVDRAAKFPPFMDVVE